MVTDFAFYKKFRWDIWTQFLPQGIENLNKSVFKESNAWWVTCCEGGGGWGFELIDALKSISLYHFNTFILKSDWLLISPYSISFESNIKVMRIKEMIINLKSPWSSIKFSLSVP